MKQASSTVFELGGTVLHSVYIPLSQEMASILVVPEALASGRGAALWAGRLVELLQTVFGSLQLVRFTYCIAFTISISSSIFGNIIQLFSNPAAMARVESFLELFFAYAQREAFADRCARQH